MIADPLLLLTVWVVLQIVGACAAIFLAWAVSACVPGERFWRRLAVAVTVGMGSRTLLLLMSFSEYRTGITGYDAEGMAIYVALQSVPGIVSAALFIWAFGTLLIDLRSIRVAVLTHEGVADTSAALAVLQIRRDVEAARLLVQAVAHDATQ